MNLDIGNVFTLASQIKGMLFGGYSDIIMKMPFGKIAGKYMRNKFCLEK